MLLVSTNSNPYNWSGSSGAVSITAPSSNTWAQLSLQGNGSVGTGINLGSSGVRHAGIFSLNGSTLSFATNPTNSGISTREHLKIDSAGSVTIPYQPSFYAYHSVTQSLPWDSVWRTLSFNSTGWNTGSCYNTSTNRFTAPVTGKYLVTWMWQIENTNSVIWTYMYPVVNGNRSVLRNKGVSFSDFMTSQNYHTENGSWIMNLTANDYVTIEHIGSSSGGISKDFKSESHWSAILIG